MAELDQFNAELVGMCDKFEKKIKAISSKATSQRDRAIKGCRADQQEIQK